PRRARADERARDRGVDGNERQHGVFAPSGCAPRIRTGGGARPSARGLEHAMNEMSPETRAFLDAVRGGAGEPSDRERREVRSALTNTLGAAATATVLATTTKAAGAAATAAFGTKAVVLALLTGAGAGLVFVGVASQVLPPPTSSRAVAASPPMTAHAPAVL